jgi:hypothetical protein
MLNMVTQTVIRLHKLVLGFSYFTSCEQARFRLLLFHKLRAAESRHVHLSATNKQNYKPRFPHQRLSNRGRRYLSKYLSSLIFFYNFNQLSYSKKLCKLNSCLHVCDNFLNKTNGQSCKKNSTTTSILKRSEYNAKPNLQSRARLCSSDRSHRSLVFLIPFTHHTAHRVPTPFSLPFFFHFPFLILTKVCCCTDITCIRFLYEKLSITIIIKIVCNFYLEKLYV